METTQSVPHSAQSYDECIRACLACYEECTRCVAHCLAQGGPHVEKKHMLLMLECAEMCRASGSIMLMQGSFAHEHCQVCARVCEACAESCRSVDPEDETMQKCADTCDACADACRRMAS